MKTYKQLLMSAACAVLALGSVNAQAEDEDAGNEFASRIGRGEKVVLFKIHDVKPIKNKKDVVTDCEFGLTLYNRSPESIESATLDLVWTDQGIVSVINEEKKQEKTEEKKTVKSLNEKYSQPTQIKTADVSDTSLKTSVILPQIKPFRQVSLRSQLQSDKCYLMMEDVDFSFSSCKIKDEAAKNDSVKSHRLSTALGDSASREVSAELNRCKSMFRFVSPRDPEYYREFQKISFNDQTVQKSEARKKDVEELGQAYDKMLKSLSSLTETLDSIK